MAKAALKVGQTYSATVVGSKRSKNAGKSVMLTVLKGGKSPIAKVSIGGEDAEEREVHMQGEDFMQPGMVNMRVVLNGAVGLNVQGRMIAYRLDRNVAEKAADAA